MPKKQTIYLETSVISAYFDFKKQDLERKRITRKFWQKIQTRYDLIVSEVVIAELRVQEEHQETFLELVDGIQRVSITTEVESIARKYTKNQIIRPSKLLDALHLACATVYQIDYLVSWNYKDLVGVTQRKAILEFNKKLNLYIPTISNPQDFLGGF